MPEGWTGEHAAAGKARPSPAARFGARRPWATAACLARAPLQTPGACATHAPTPSKDHGHSMTLHRTLSLPSATALALAAGLALGGFGAVAPAFAQEDKPLARVDGQPIVQKDLDAAAEDLGDRLPAMADAQKRDYLLTYVIDLKLGAKAAAADKIGDTPEFARRLAYLRDKLLLDEYLSHETKKAVTPEAAQKLYEDTVKTLKPDEERRARHILVEGEDEAKKVFARVKGGEDFAKVAAELSKDPGSGKEGGDLGYFTKDRMVKEFADVAFAAKVGDIVGPVKSQFGWHVIKVEDARTKPLPTFDEVKTQIDTYLGQKAQQDLIVALREKAKIERLDKPETPAAPGAAAPATPAPAAPKP